MKILNGYKGFVIEASDNHSNEAIAISTACILNEDGNLELFSKRKDSVAIKEIDDNIIPGMATIGKMNGVVLISYDNKISEMRMVK